MSYNKKTWVSNETITKDDLNNIENGIYEVSEVLQEHLDDTIIEEKIGDLDTLETEDKTDLVSAINELSQNIENAGIDEEQVQEIVENMENLVTKEDLEDIYLSTKQDKTDSNLITESKDIVGAINELFQSANNGKELIASAIGEPLSSEDTFSAMSDDINSLLSTFKSNMMNNGVTVESSDKFKALIDKVATIADLGGGLDIISATELPATGKEGQICVITDNPVDIFIISSNSSDIKTDDVNAIYIPNIYNDQSKTVIVGDKIKTNYYFNYMVQGEDRLASYIYTNSIWEELTNAFMVYFENGVLLNEDFFGAWVSGDNTIIGTYINLKHASTEAVSSAFTTGNKINLNNYSKVEVTCYIYSTSGTTGNSTFSLYPASSSFNTANIISSSYYPYIVSQLTTNTKISTTLTTLTFDISSWTGEHYLAFHWLSSVSGTTIWCRITGIKLY